VLKFIVHAPHRSSIRIQHVAWTKSAILLDEHKGSPGIQPRGKSTWLVPSRSRARWASTASNSAKSLAEVPRAADSSFTFSSCRHQTAAQVMPQSIGRGLNVGQIIPPSPPLSKITFFLSHTTLIFPLRHL
jgi:hypothetical protein